MMTDIKYQTAEQIIQAGIQLKKTGLIARTWGNISARISDTQFMITPSGRAYETLTVNQIVTVNIDHLSYEGEIPPSGEMGVHAAVYKQRPEVGFIIHTHQEAATVVSLTGETLFCNKEKEGAFSKVGDVIPCASYGMPSSRELQRNVEMAVSQYPTSNAVLMRFHGTVCMGKNDTEAFAAAMELERICQEKIKNIFRKEVSNPFFLSRPKKISGSVVSHPGMELPDDFIAEMKKECGFCVAGQVMDPYVVWTSAQGQEVLPTVDDLAQIAGESLQCLLEDASVAQICQSFRDRNAVLLRGKGALIGAESEEDYYALKKILIKGCKAYCYSHALGRDDHLKREEAIMLRRFYTEKYSAFMNT